MVITNSLELRKNPTLIHTNEHINALLENKHYDEVMDIVRSMYAGADTDRTALVNMLIAIGENSPPSPATESQQSQNLLNLILESLNAQAGTANNLKAEPDEHDLETAALQLLHVPPPQPRTPASASVVSTLTALTAVEPAFTPLEQTDARTTLMVHLMGSFEVYVNHQRVTEWSNRKGKLLFKYLVTNREQRVPKEILMDTFWPDSDPDAARNNLNVTMYALRRDLHQHDPDFSHIVFEDDCYVLNPDMLVWVDSEKFIEHARQGQQLEQAGHIFEAIKAYRAASSLYKGPFLGEVTYEEWIELPRQHIQNTYLHVLDRLCYFYFEQKDYAACINACNEMIAIDSCREDAHRRLMLCYERQGHPYLALRQYQLCKDFLKRELDIEPGEETTTLFERIRDQRS